MKIPFLFTCRWGIRLEHLFISSDPEKEEEKGKRACYAHAHDMHMRYCFHTSVPTPGVE